MSQTLQVTGELIDPQMVKLDQPIALTSGKVRVTVELLPGEKGSNLREFMKRMWEEQRLRGHVPRTKEEIDAYLNAERDSWDS
jgi:hypothetical protein